MFNMYSFLEWQVKIRIQDFQIDGAHKSSNDIMCTQHTSHKSTVPYCCGPGPA